MNMCDVKRISGLGSVPELDSEMAIFPIQFLELELQNVTGQNANWIFHFNSSN